MKKLQNSLYITKQKAYVHKERETIVIECDRNKLLQLPVHSIKSIFCFGNVMVSPFLLGFCAEKNIGLAFFTEYGRFLARMQGKQSGNVLLRRAQYKLSEKAPLTIARNIIAAKIVNSRAVLQRQVRNYENTSQLERAISRLKHSLEQARNCREIDSLRGIEGEAASVYFSVFNQLLRNSDFKFEGRNRRPPKDPVNAMMSFLYSVFGQDISAALQGVGLDPQVGFLHVDRPGRDSLAQDLLEEFRASFVDRLVLSLVNRKQISLKGFTTESSGAVNMDDDTRKALLVAYQEKKQEEIMHPYLKEKVPIGLLPHIQAQLLAAHIRGDLAEYPPFISR
jgi:CRISPR-associated protein Cas1